MSEIFGDDLNPRAQKAMFLINLAFMGPLLIAFVVSALAAMGDTSLLDWASQLPQACCTSGIIIFIIAEAIIFILLERT